MTPPKSFMAFRPDPDLALAMATLTERDGISTSEQIRRALREWLAARGVYKIPKEKKKVYNIRKDKKKIYKAARHTAHTNK